MRQLLVLVAFSLIAIPYLAEARDGATATAQAGTGAWAEAQAGAATATAIAGSPLPLNHTTAASTTTTHAAATSGSGGAVATALASTDEGTVTVHDEDARFAVAVAAPSAPGKVVLEMAEPAGASSVAEGKVAPANQSATPTIAISDESEATSDQPTSEIPPAVTQAMDESVELPITETTVKRLSLLLAVIGVLLLIDTGLLIALFILQLRNGKQYQRF